MQKGAISSPKNLKYINFIFIIVINYTHEPFFFFFPFLLLGFWLWLQARKQPIIRASAQINGPNPSQSPILNLVSLFLNQLHWVENRESSIRSKPREKKIKNGGRTITRARSSVHVSGWYHRVGSFRGWPHRIKTLSEPDRDLQSPGGSGERLFCHLRELRFSLRFASFSSLWGINFSFLFGSQECVGNRVVKKKEISLLFEFSFVSGFSLVAEKRRKRKRHQILNLALFEFVWRSFVL